MTATQPDRQTLRSDEETVREFFRHGFDAPTAREAFDRIIGTAQAAPAAEGGDRVCLDQTYCRQPYCECPSPKPTPDAVREALKRELRISSPHDYREWISIVAAVERVFAATVPSPDGAIEQARQEVVLAIAFLGRDNGTDRLQATVAALIPGLAKADAILRSFVPPSATGAAEPDDQDPPMKWLIDSLRQLARDLLADPKTPWIGERDPKQHICWTAADQLATPPVRGDRDREAIALCVGNVSRKKWGLPPATTISGANWDLYLEFADAILSLPVQPGAGERESFNHDDVVRLVLAARTVAFGADHGGDEGMRELDQASEQFAASIPWEDQPSEDEL